MNNNIYSEGAVDKHISIDKLKGLLSTLKKDSGRIREIFLIYELGGAKVYTVQGVPEKTL